jgi:hypothetical protein
MKTFNTKLALAAVGIAMLATPAFAQTQRQDYSYSQQQSADHYPNGSLASGSADAVRSGAQFNTSQ